jgi:hypothetical protein
MISGAIVFTGLSAVTKNLKIVIILWLNCSSGDSRMLVAECRMPVPAGRDSRLHGNDNQWFTSRYGCDHFNRQVSGAV